jgi:hypothetical protein
MRFTVSSQQRSKQLWSIDPQMQKMAYPFLDFQDIVSPSAFCKICSKAYSSKKEWLDHHETFHRTEYVSFCGECWTTQRNGLSVECDRSWIRSLLAVVCFEPQILHVNILSSAVEWNFILCSTEPFIDLNALQHSPQNETYSVLWNVSWWSSHSFFELWYIVEYVTWYVLWKRSRIIFF